MVPIQIMQSRVCVNVEKVFIDTHFFVRLTFRSEINCSIWLLSESYCHPKWH